MSDFKMPTAYENVPCEWTAGIVQREEADGAAVLKAIDQLRRDLSGYHGQLKAHDDMQRHCDNQRKRIAELEELYAKAKLEKYEADSAYLTEYDRAEYLARQKAKLREQVVQSFDKTSELETENAKLRELARDMWQDLLVHGYKVQNVMHARYDRRMRELGIEVDA